MADIKITALPALAATADVLDVLAIVDVSDNGVIASGTTKSVLISELPYLANGSNISLLTNDSGYKTVSDFSNNGEAATANRDIGNTDAFGLSLITSGLGRINILSGGDVGIGTALPTNKLTVNVTTDGDGIRANYNDDLFGIMNYDVGLGGQLALYDDAVTQKVFLKSKGNSSFTGGNLSVGTTAATQSFNIASAAGNAGISLNNTGASGVEYLLTSHSTGSFQIYDLDNVAARLYIQKTTGNVGIGTTTPTEKLEVAGNVKVGGTLAVNQATGVSTFTGTGASDTRIDLHNASTASLVRLRFGSSGAGANCAIAYNGATSAHISTFYQNSLYTNAQSGSKRIESTTGGYFIVTDNGSLSLPVTRLEMDTSGRFGFGITPDAALLVSVGGSIKVNGAVDFFESAAISTPAANYGRVYAKTDGKVYYKNDAGTDYNLTNDGLSHVEVINAKTFTWTNGLLVSVV